MRKDVQPNFRRCPFQYRVMGILSFLLLPEIFLVISGTSGTFMRSYSDKVHSHIVVLSQNLTDFQRLRCGLVNSTAPAKNPGGRSEQTPTFFRFEMRCRTVEVYTLLFALLLDNINQFICIRKFHLCITEYNHIAASRQCFFHKLKKYYAVFAAGKGNMETIK